METNVKPVAIILQSLQKENVRSKNLKQRYFLNKIIFKKITVREFTLFQRIFSVIKKVFFITVAVVIGEGLVLLILKKCAHLQSWLVNIGFLLKIILIFIYPTG